MSARHARLCLACALPAILALTPATSLSAATVEVVVSGVLPGAGAVLASLCERALDRATCERGQRQPGEASVLTFVFPDLEPGRYAALAFQDTEGNGALRRSRMGRPLEPYGLSNGAGRARRPTFGQTAVPVGPEGRRIDVRLEPPGAP